MGCGLPLECQRAKHRAEAFGVKRAFGAGACCPAGVYTFPVGRIRVPLRLPRRVFVGASDGRRSGDAARTRGWSMPTTLAYDEAPTTRSRAVRPAAVTRQPAVAAVPTARVCIPVPI